MANMVLLKCDSGSRAATVLCPCCGRISRQILSTSFFSNRVSELIRPHTCPICNESYQKCDPSIAQKWMAAFARYNHNAEEYNRSVKSDYSQRPADTFQPARVQSAVSQREETVPPLFSNTPSKPAPLDAPSQMVANKKAKEEKTRKVQEENASRSNVFTSNNAPVAANVTQASFPSLDDQQNTSSTISDEGLDRKVARWKRELLDTGKRNRMINFRETKRSTLRILEPEANELFNRLAFSEKPLTFQKPINKDTDLRTYSMIALMETLSYTLNAQKGDIKTSGTIIEREKTLKNLRSKAKLAQEEQGTNILYLCFGFIYWRENNRESGTWFKAPLLMMPVALGLKSLNSPYTLSRYDDEIEVNPTLDYLFNSEYNIDLPTFDLKNKESFEDYFAQIEDIVDKRGWKVTREVNLGLLSFLKISMYHDLNNNRDLVYSHPVLRAMAGDRMAIGDLPAEAEHFNFDSTKPSQWHEVIDSDSSQEEAILLSKLGVSFVMQGPPGTGKSQTITNIIAEALADKKKVLFVSEKAAALQVVLKRLSEVHLDDFCLSLHNYKANKKEIIENIGSNLNLEDEYIDRSDLSELTDLFRDREFLNAYADELHKTIEPLDQSVYMAFGKLSKLENATALEFAFEKPNEVTKEQYASILYCVSAFEKALHNLSGRLSENPWYATKATSSGQTYKQQLLAETNGLSEGLRQIADLANQVDSLLATGKNKSFDDIKSLLEITSILSARPAFMKTAWFDSDVSSHCKKLLSEAKEHANRLHHHRQAVITEWDEAILTLDVKSIQEHFYGDYSWIYNCEGNSTIEQRLADEQDVAKAFLIRLEELLASLKKGLNLISYNQKNNTVDDIRMVSRVLSQIAEAPYMEASWFDLRRNAEIAPLIDEAIQHSTEIKSLTETVLKDWEPTALDIDAEQMLARFKTEYVGVFHTMKSAYKEDIRTLRLHSKAIGGKIDEANAISFLQKLKELKNVRAWFDANEEPLKAAVGRNYRGENTDWNRVRESMAAAVSIAEEFPYSSITEETITAIMRITSSIQLTGEARQIAEKLSYESISSAERDIESCRYIVVEGDICISEDLLQQIERFIEHCDTQRQYVAEFTSRKKNATLVYHDITELLSNVAAVNAENDWFEEHRDDLNGLFGEAYVQDESDWEEIQNGINTAERLSALFNGDVPETIVTITCNQKPVSDGFQEQVSTLSRIACETEPKLEVFSAQFEGAAFGSFDLCSVANHYDACIDGFGELNKWLDYAETREDCNKHGLSDFTDKIARLDNTVVDVQDTFERGFNIQWLNAQMDKVPAVQSFRRRIHEQRSERFIRLDSNQYQIAQKRIRESIISTFPSIDRVAKAGSELGILRHEMGKKMRHMPLRKLFRSIPNLLLTLKPCLMMSPLSVAYFLEADTYHFDMVIFDEASQVFPQDAIGAIFRAKQVIIAGDTKQLPPTNFFAASTSNSSEGYDDDEGYDEEVYDSILEETANILPNRTLRWHYRSKHEHLIAFSNQEIYKNELVTFPSTNESEPDTGVEFVFVEDGYYEPSPKNYNILEAKRIVQLVKDHIDSHPERSLGIIAFSEKQQQAIALEIQRFREKNSEYEDFFVEDKEDEFFVKNLENVQGDERDTIIFSVGYAKTKEQITHNRPMSMRFGPLGISGGERRLNVAITRAKINVKLVSSILPSDIDLSRTESEGIRMLRSYIEFAMNGEATLAAAHKIKRPDVFADSVAQFIQAHGFKVQQYIGCSGYKIDIAVKHPSDTIDQYVAGIECDGFSYVSAKTARDRDRLRSSILKNMGWNLYRVWSAEWYKNPEIEGQKLLEFITNAIAGCDEKIKLLEEEKRKKEEAKQQELERARVEREAEERRRQRELEENEAKEREAREAAERRRREEREAKAAKQKPLRNKESVPNNGLEQLADQILRETVEEPQRRDLSWVKPGVRVNHSRFGQGVVLSIAKDTIRIRFAQGEKVLSYPSAFETGVLSRQASAPQPQQPKGPEWATVGACVSHKHFGSGVIKSIESGHITISFGNVEKTFVYPNAFIDGFLFQGSQETIKDDTLETTSKKNEETDSLLNQLRSRDFLCIDNRSSSSILWVLYNPKKEKEFEQIAAQFNVQYRLEKRGALATNGEPAWRVMQA